MEGPDGSVWLEEQASNKVGKWDPKTKEITEYQDSYIPGQEGLLTGGGKHTVRIDKEGIVWSTGSPFSSFDPKTGKFTHYEAAPTIYGIDIDKDDNVWFDGFAMDGKLFEGRGENAKDHRVPAPHSRLAAADPSRFGRDHLDGRIQGRENRAVRS